MSTVNKLKRLFLYLFLLIEFQDIYVLKKGCFNIFLYKDCYTFYCVIILNLIIEIMKMNLYKLKNHLQQTKKIGWDKTEGPNAIISYDTSAVPTMRRHNMELVKNRQQPTKRKNHRTLWNIEFSF